MYFSGFKLKYTHEEKTRIEPKEIVEHGTLTFQEFKLWSFLDWLPKKFEFQYYSHHLETANLRCDPVIGCSQAKNSCWCDVAEKLVFKDLYEKTFKLKSSMYQARYLLDVKIERRPTTTDQVDLTLKIRHESRYEHNYTGYSRNTSYPSTTTSYPSTTTTNTTLSYVNPKSDEKVEFTSNNYLSNAKFEFVCQELPDKIEIKTTSTTYLIKEGLRCQKISTKKKQSRACPTGDGVVCWCSLINQLRSTRSGRIRVPLYTIAYNGDYTKYSNYFMVVDAEVDPKDHDQINLKVSTLYNNHYAMDDISFIDF